MKDFRVIFIARVPDDVTEAQVREWVEFHLHVGSLAISNPLADKDLDAAGHISIYMQGRSV